MIDIENCGRCGQRSELVARVTSDMIDLVVCWACGLEAVRLGLKIDPLGDDMYRQWKREHQSVLDSIAAFQRAAKNHFMGSV